MIASVDGLINEFTVNDSLKTSDSRLVAVINKRDFAAQAVSSASNFFNTGSYPSARGSASQGLDLANQAWNLSLNLKTDLGQGFQLPGLPNLGALLPFLVVIVVVAIIAGVVIYSEEDALGRTRVKISRFILPIFPFLSKYHSRSRPGYRSRRTSSSVLWSSPCTRSGTGRCPGHR